MSLDAGAGGLARLTTATTRRPGSGQYLAGRARERAWRKGELISVEYGRETFFAEKFRAVEFERQACDGAVAEITLTERGTSGRVRDGN